MKVYKLIIEAQKELSAVGIGKERRNQQQGYNFRGVDDFLQTMSPVLAKVGLAIIPTKIVHEASSKATANGKEQNYSRVDVEYTLIADDGSSIVGVSSGMAMDMADKALPKALSMAYKSFCTFAFSIPLEGVPDADDDHQVITNTPTATAADSKRIATITANLNKVGAKLDAALAYVGAKSLESCDERQLQAIEDVIAKKIEAIK